jgi:hypothetical protein
MREMTGAAAAQETAGVGGTGGTGGSGGIGGPLTHLPQLRESVPHLSVYAKPIHAYDDFRASLFLGSYLCELHPVLTPLASYVMDRCWPAERFHRPYLILVRTGRLQDIVR